MDIPRDRGSHDLEVVVSKVYFQRLPQLLGNTTCKTKNISDRLKPRTTGPVVIDLWPRPMSGLLGREASIYRLRPTTRILR